MAAQLDNDDPRRPKGMRINSRLVGLLLVPLAVLIAVTGFGVVQGFTQSNQASELSERTALASSAYALIDALEVERSTLVAESTSSVDQQAAVRSAADELTARGAQVGGSLQQETDAVLRRIRGVELLASGGIGGRSALRSYSVTIDELLDLATRAIDPAGAVDGSAAATTDYLARAHAASAQEYDLVKVLEAEGEISAVSFQDLSSLAASQRAYSALAAEIAPAVLSIRIREVAFAISAADEIRRDAFVATLTPSFGPWLEGLDARTESLSSLQGLAQGAAVATVDDLAESSRILLVTATLAMVAILLISALLLRRANRSIARPLQDLARQAEDVAQHRLPEAVRSQQHIGGGAEVHLPAVRAAGAAEVHEVAAAFNDVQDTALRLAGEQAALRVNQSEAMTNLGRRNQTLLARQLDFITSLETRETDPEFLEHLFKLDHLASRMRRNAESLLILAGSETPRRRRSPAPVAEVVRAAMSEVEEFERVRIGSLSGATVSGPVVIDLVHLLAELIENALNFSPPDTTVEIDGRTLGQGGYQFAVIDHGVGMTDVELLSANHRMRGLDELEGMPTRYLGQYVVAKLASKTSAMVTLQKSSGGRGVTALVNLPATALVGPTDRGVAGRPLPGSQAAREAGPAPFAPGAGLSTGASIGTPEQTPVDVPADAAVEASADDVDLTWGDGAELDAVPSGAGGLRWGDADDLAPTSDSNEPDAPGDPDDELTPSGDSWVAASTPDAVEGPVAPPLIEAHLSGGADQVGADQVGADQVGADQVGADRSGADEDETVLGAFAAAPSFLPAPQEPGTHDPWAAFRDDDLVEAADDAIAASSEPAPSAEPPEPPPAPAQIDWVPLEQATAEASTMRDRAGGLARRVPGATLAQQRSGDHDVRPAPDRSADGVRSMLASFQAGRTRGRGIAPDAGAVAAETLHDTFDQSARSKALHDPNPSIDPVAPSAESDTDHGRSPQ